MKASSSKFFLQKIFPNKLRGGLYEQKHGRDMKEDEVIKGEVEISCTVLTDLA